MSRKNKADGSPAGIAISNFLASQGLPAVGGGRYFANAVDTRTTGGDLTLRYKLYLRQIGKVTLTASGNVNKTEVTKFKPTPPLLAAIGITTPLFDLTEKIRMEKGQPSDNLNFIVGYNLKKWSFTLRNIRYGEVSTVAFASATPAQVAALTPGYDVELAETVPASANKQIIQTFAAKWITDLDITCRVSRRFTASVGVNNLFNIYPAENIRSRVVGGTAFNGSDNFGTFPYNNISPFGFNGASYYGKLNYKF